MGQYAKPSFPTENRVRRGKLCAIKVCWDFYFLFTYGNIYLQRSPLWLPGSFVKQLVLCGLIVTWLVWFGSLFVQWLDGIYKLHIIVLDSFLFSKKPCFLQCSWLGLELGGALEIFLSPLPLFGNDIKQNKFLQLYTEMAMGPGPGQTSGVGN